MSHNKKAKRVGDALGDGSCTRCSLHRSMDGLTATQQHALSQLQTITNGESDVAKSVLESVDWDVQVMSSLIVLYPPYSISSFFCRKLQK